MEYLSQIVPVPIFAVPHLFFVGVLVVLVGFGEEAREERRKEFFFRKTGRSGFSMEAKQEDEKERKIILVSKDRLLTVSNNPSFGQRACRIGRRCLFYNSSLFKEIAGGGGVFLVLLWSSSFLVDTPHLEQIFISISSGKFFFFFSFFLSFLVTLLVICDGRKKKKRERERGNFFARGVFFFFFFLFFFFFSFWVGIKKEEEKIGSE